MENNNYSFNLFFWLLSSLKLKLFPFLSLEFAERVTLHVGSFPMAGWLKSFENVLEDLDKKTAASISTPKKGKLVEVINSKAKLRLPRLLLSHPLDLILPLLSLPLFFPPDFHLVLKNLLQEQENQKKKIRKRTSLNFSMLL